MAAARTSQGAKAKGTAPVSRENTPITAGYTPRLYTASTVAGDSPAQQPQPDRRRPRGHGAPEQPLHEGRHHWLPQARRSADGEPNQAAQNRALGAYPGQCHRTNSLSSAAKTAMNWAKEIGFLAKPRGGDLGAVLFVWRECELTKAKPKARDPSPNKNDALRSPARIIAHRVSGGNEEPGRRRRAGPSTPPTPAPRTAPPRRPP